MKRNIGVPTPPAPVFIQETSPSIPSKTVDVPTSAPSPPPKSSAEKVSPFMNVSVEKAAKLAAIEAIRSDGYVVVSSPTVCIIQLLKFVSCTTTHAFSPSF